MGMNERSDGETAPKAPNRGVITGRKDAKKLRCLCVRVRVVLICFIHESIWGRLPSEAYSRTDLKAINRR